MKTHWMHRTGRPDCLVFVAGWGMDPTPFEFLGSRAWDVLLLYDHRELAAPPEVEAALAAHDRVVLLAWSMGVWVAARVFGGCRDAFAAAIALCGTLTPIDARRGTPPEACDSLAADLTPSALHRFHAGMFSDAGEATRFLRHAPRRALPGLLEELLALRSAYARLGEARDIYSRRLIASRDVVVPARNQMRAWNKGPHTLLRAPHFPFYRWTTWDDLLREALAALPGSTKAFHGTS